VRILGSVLLVAALSAQQPIFRSGADLVRFDVRVTDASGRPLRDLRPEEIEIVVVCDLDGRVVCRYSGEGHKPYWIALVRSWLSRWL
jgi:hypothetical protein